MRASVLVVVVTLSVVLAELAGHDGATMMGSEGGAAAAAAGAGGGGGAAAAAIANKALNLRVKADEAVKKQDYTAALTALNEAIDIEPENAVNYYKRSVVSAIQGRTPKSIVDLDKAIALDPTMTSAYSSRAKQHEQVGSYDFALADLGTLKAMGQDVTEKTQDVKTCSLAWAKGVAGLASNEPLNEVMDYFNYVVDCSPKFVDVRLRRSDVFMALGEVDNAIADVSKAIKFRPDLLDPPLLLSKLYYNKGDLDKSMESVRTCLQSDPDYKPCKDWYKSLQKLHKAMSKGNTALEERKYVEAVEKFTEALAAAGDVQAYKLKALVRLCEAQSKGKLYADAIETCGSVLALEADNIDALIYRGDARSGMEMFKEALQDYSQARNKRPNDGHIKGKVDEAQKKLKAASRKDYYKILGLPKGADEKQVKKAYKEKARVWHPDKHDAGPERDKATIMFKDIAEAKEVLLDKDKRRKYDAGEDPFTNQGSGGGGGGGGFQFPQGFNPFRQHGGGGGGHQHFHFNFG